MRLPLAATDSLIVFALESEAQELFDGMNAVYCGVGKVNATYHLTRTLDAWRHKKGAAPKLVVNLGSAGSAHFKTGSLINCTRFIQRDFDVTALGFDAYVTPFENTLAILDNGMPVQGYPDGICGSGDSFVAEGSPAKHPTLWNVVDMEAYALAKICALESIPFVCLKYITDGADHDAAASWETRLAEAARALRHATSTLLTV